MGRTDDLISRAAAIEAIGERPLNWTDTHGELQAISDWDGYIAALKSVPAVDAIPVEWFEGVIRNLRAKGRKEYADVMQIILDAWNDVREPIVKMDGGEKDG